MTDAPRPRLDVRDLQVVLALAAAGSTAKAAPRLHLTQSAVSRALREAENKLGVALFRRDVRGLTPTGEGERLIAGARDALAHLVELERRTLAPVADLRVIRLVCECYTAYRWLPSTLARLRTVMPGVDLVLRIDHTGSPAAALVDGEVDIALLTTSEVPRTIEVVPLFSDEVVFMMSPSHPLASRTAVSRRDLRENVLLVSTSTPDAERHWFSRQVFGRTRPKLRLLALPLTEAIADAARAGMGVAVLSEWIASPYLAAEDLVVRRFEGGPLLRPWRMAFRSEARDVVRSLCAAMQDAGPRIPAVRLARRR